MHLIPPLNLSEILFCSSCDSLQGAMTTKISLIYSQANPLSPLLCCVEQQTCTRAWKIFRICFWMRTEKMVASASSWVMSCWILGKKIFMAASKGFLSSAFLYLKEHTEENDKNKQTKKCRIWTHVDITVYPYLCIFITVLKHSRSGFICIFSLPHGWLLLIWLYGKLHHLVISRLKTYVCVS